MGDFLFYQSNVYLCLQGYVFLVYLFVNRITWKVMAVRMDGHRKNRSDLGADSHHIK